MSHEKALSRKQYKEISFLVKPIAYTLKGNEKALWKKKMSSQI